MPVLVIHLIRILFSFFIQNKQSNQFEACNWVGRHFSSIKSRHVFLYLSKVFCTIQKTQNASVWMHPESDDKQKIDLIKTEMNTFSMIRKKWHCRPWYSRSLMIIIPTYSGTKTNPNDQGVWIRGMGFRDRHRSPCFRESRSKNFQGWQNYCMNSCISACVNFVPLRF